MTSPTLGVIFGNRDFFPDPLVTEARQDILRVLKRLHIQSIMLGENDSKLGGVETYDDAVKCAELFHRERDKIDGILVVLPNFGDEKGVSDTLKLAKLNVPVLIQGYPDEFDKLDVARRRDAFCGKISVCNNLIQCGIKYSITEKHVVCPSDESFENDLKKFSSVCRVVNGLRRVRIGMVGARPGAFNTVRYSEKILEHNGISVTTIDLSEILSEAGRLDGNEQRVKQKIESIREYGNSKNVPDEKMIQIGKLSVVLDHFIASNHLDATAIQCWVSLQKNYGCNVCTSMSMMSEKMIPSACETDVTGVLTMYAMQLASGSPSALVDWNNNYGDEEDKCVLFHCGNWAKSFLPDIQIKTAPILGTTVGEQNTFGALEGRTPAGLLTFGRLTTDDIAGLIRGYIGHGSLTNDPLDTFGCRAVAHVPNLQKLLQYVCRHGFEHHVAISVSHTADILFEAFDNYLGWEVYYHGSKEV